MVEAQRLVLAWWGIFVDELDLLAFDFGDGEDFILKSAIVFVVAVVVIVSACEDNFVADAPAAGIVLEGENGVTCLRIFGEANCVFFGCPVDIDLTVADEAECQVSRLASLPMESNALVK